MGVGVGQLLQLIWERRQVKDHLPRDGPFKAAPFRDFDAFALLVWLDCNKGVTVLSAPAGLADASAPCGGASPSQMPTTDLQ